MLATALLSLFCLGFSACGGSAGSSSSASTAGSAPQEAITTTTTTPSSQPEQVRDKLRKKAGQAAPFLTSQGDNSIPTYGSEASGSRRAEASKVLTAYLIGRMEENWGKLCSLLGATPRRQLETLGRASTGASLSCPKNYQTLAGRGLAAELDNPMVGRVVALRVKGEKAFALFYGSHRQQYMMPMALEGGSWKANQIAPVAYPIGAPVGGH